MTKNTGSSVKWIIIAVASLLFLGLFSYLIILAKQNKNQASNTTVSLSSDGWVRGNASASATLVEFGDFQCPACKAYEPFVKRALSDFEGRIKLIYKHFPLTSIHKNAVAAAIAAEASGKQNKFWEMHDKLFDRQAEWAELTAIEAEEKFIFYAEELKLDINKFKENLNDITLREKVGKMQEEGFKAGVSGTPTFFINGKLITNPSDYSQFKDFIEKEIK